MTFSMVEKFAKECLEKELNYEYEILNIESKNIKQEYSKEYILKIRTVKQTYLNTHPKEYKHFIEIEDKKNKIIKDLKNIKTLKELNEYTPTSKVFETELFFRIENCSNCSGSGYYDCEECRGTGYKKDMRFKNGLDPNNPCKVCGGSGKGERCNKCNGSGDEKVSYKYVLELNYSETKDIMLKQIILSNVASNFNLKYSESIDSDTYKFVFEWTFPCVIVKIKTKNKVRHIHIITDELLEKYICLDNDAISIIKNHEEKMQEYETNITIKKNSEIIRIAFFIVSMILIVLGFYFYANNSPVKPQKTKIVKQVYKSNKKGGFQVVKELPPSQIIDIVDVNKLLKDCDNDDPKACKRLAYAYGIGGLWLDKDTNKSYGYYKKTVDIYKNGCDTNNAKYCYELAHAYENGNLKLTKDIKTANFYYNKACRLGYKLDCN